MRSQQTILVTGGAGFIGSNFILHWLAQEDSRVVNLDKLTYAGNPANLAELNDDSRYVFARGDINDSSLVSDLLQRHQPAATGRTPVLGRACRNGKTEFSFSARFNRRSLWIAGPHGPGIHGENPVRSQQSLCGVKSFI